MIRVAIVEDDAEVQGVLQEYVRRYTRQYGTEFEVTLFADGVDILDDYRAVYDIIFLDVEMKHLDGMTTAERIRQMDAEVILIFITNMAQYAIRGYAVGALDYVLKPVPYFAFSQQLQKALGQLEKRERHYLAVAVDGGMRRLDAAEIYYLESEGHKVHFYTEKEDFVVPGTLKNYEEKLVGMVAFKAVRSLFFPAPLRTAYAVVKAVPYLFRALRCLLRRQLHVELLDGISICLSMARRDFDTASSVMFLLRLGELLEEWTHKKSVENLARSMSLNIDRVWMKTENGEELLPLHQVQAGDQVVVRMGGMIPLDGTIVEGEVMVNQASLTGESIPVPKRPGSSVYAGTVVEEGECVLTVTQQSGEGRYDKIVAMIEESEQLKSAAENHAAHLADQLVPYTLAGSALVYLLTRNVTRALSVLMVDFSCALKLSMPLAVLSAMSEASRFHVTVKGGKYLEAVAQADTIVFDKTGTLTHASPVVAQVIPFGGNKEPEMLRLAACLEEHFPHSMANAVVQAARERGLAHEEMHSQVEYLVAHGIASTVDGRRVIIGSAHFVFEDEGCTVPPGEQDAFDTLPKQYSHLYLAVGGVLAAVICISDPLRAEAKDAIRALHACGIRKVVMMTGDNRRTAAAVAAELETQYHTALLGTTQQVLFEQEEDGLYAGHAMNYVKVYVQAADLHNEIRAVRITELCRDGVFGELE